MKKVKYYYDSENLAYRKIKTKKRTKVGYFALFIVAAALFGILSFVVLLNTPFFETPKDRLQAREIERRTSLLSQYCTGSISGLGLQSYISGIEYFLTKR